MHLALHGLGRRAWERLPLLLGWSAAVCAAALACLLAAQWALALALVPAVVIGTPAMAGTLAAADAVVRDRTVSFRSVVHLLRRIAGPLLLLALAPAVMAVLTGAALLAHHRGGGPLMLVPAALGASVCALTALAAVMGGALAVRLAGDDAGPRWVDDPADAPVGLDDRDARRADAGRDGLPGHVRRAVSLGGLGLHVLARTPLPFLAAGLLAAAGAWMSITVSNGLLLLVPAPVALVLALALLSSRAVRDIGGDVP
jgi:hypothetical protein